MDKLEQNIFGMFFGQTVSFEGKGIFGCKNINLIRERYERGGDLKIFYTEKGGT